jgi:hypothetical protein
MWYNEGTVSLVQGSVTVIGVGTDFVSNSRSADMFVGPDGRIYEVVNYTNEKTLAIKPAYLGPSISNSPDFFVVPIQGYTKLAADRLHKITLSIGNIEGDVAASAQNAAEAKAARDAAEASEAAAKISEDNAKASEAGVAQSAASALSSKNAAASSESVASTKAAQAAASQAAAQDSEEAAAASALAAHNSQVSAASSEAVAISKATIASDKADIAITKANEASLSASDALDSKNAAAQSETNANNDAIATSADRIQVANDKAVTTAARDEAVAAAATVTGSVIDKGYIDLSGGAYPAKPAFSAFWKVTVGGTVGGEEYGIGDTLVYTKPQDTFYKIDNTESVSSVAGFKGAVTKAQLGIDQIDNTPDAAKPVSTPQATALALKVAIADIVDNLASTAVDKPLSAKQGKVLYDMVQSNNTTIVRYTYFATAGQTTFTGADANGKTLSYVPGIPLIVTLNGVDLEITADYLATSGSSLVLTEGAALGEQLTITTFGAFSVVNHYTIAQEDALFAQRYLKSETDALLANNLNLVPQGFIEGLQLVWNSGTSISVRAGSAYIPSIGKRVSYAGGTIAPITVPVINTFIHLYINAAGAIVQSLTVPVKYYNTAWAMTGDNSNRYIGSMLISTNAAGAYKFRQDLTSNKLWYIQANPTSAPFRAISSQTTPATVSLSSVVPVTGVTVLGVFQNAGALGNIVYFTPADAGTPVSDTGWMIYLTGGAVQNAECPLSSAGAISIGGNGASWSANLYCNGYQFER